MKTKEFLEMAAKKHRGLNRELIRKVAARLRNLRHEAHYNQMDWVRKTECGTTACIAGWACLEMGLSPKAMVDLVTDWRLNAVIGEESPVSLAARNLLGLSEEQAHALFSDNPDRVWPESYGDRFDDAVYGECKERPSRVAADLLEAVAAGKVKLA